MADQHRSEQFFNPALEENVTFVRPAYFIIAGFIGIPYINYYFVFLFFVYILSVVGNTTVLTVIVLDHTLRGPKYVAVFSLALTDILSSTAVVPKCLDIFMFNHYYISYNECLTFMFVCFTLLAMQCFNLVAMSYDRLMAIMYPLHYQVKVTQKFMINLIVFLWLFAITVNLTIVGLITRLSFCKSVVINSYFCDHGPVYRLGCNDVSPSRVIGVLTTVIMLWVPLAFILATYCCIAYALLKLSTVQERKKAFKTCSGHLSLVTIYFLPISLVFGFGSKMHPNARIINLSLTTIIPPMLNPIIYVFQTQEIKQSFNKLVRKRRQSKIAG
ncbi:olfactory receptor 6C4-like [Girardinichthys multiradiatus]|uniref:olfactory receptor 6C4-like n=1 Tax=Girardinichthys multiradiatus TaxID=208333 RepID=UPI001FACBA5B|nr:olfactory receptor 6C4-like [Girardinichthys multiradiatus]